MSCFDKTTLVVTLLAAGAFLALESGIASLVADEDCRQPSSTVVPCTFAPPGVVGSCNVFDGVPGLCAGAMTMHINLFPDGSVAADEGDIKIADKPCYRTQNCFFDVATGTCNAGPWSLWTYASKVVADPGSDCKEIEEVDVPTPVF